MASAQPVIVVVVVNVDFDADGNVQDHDHVDESDVHATDLRDLRD